MALTVHEHHIARVRRFQGNFERLFPIWFNSILRGDFLQSHDHIVDDTQRVFAPRVIACQDHQAAE